jgi:hypothetical protein
MLATILAAFAGCRPPVDGEDEPKFRETSLIATPSQLDLGDIAPGELRSGTMSLLNKGSEVVIVRRITTSCPCLRSLTTLPIRVEPGGTTILELSFDPENELSFRGGLSVEVEGFGGDAKAVFQTSVVMTIGASKKDGS